jgi:hypothetical protein
LYFLYEVQHDAAIEDTKFTGYGSQIKAIDTWKSASRWKRGLFTGRWYVKIISLVVFLASLACAGLGLWGKSIKILVTSDLFSCLIP